MWLALCGRLFVAEFSRTPEHLFFDWDAANTPSTPKRRFNDNVELAEGVSEHLPASCEEDEGAWAKVLDTCEGFDGKISDEHERLAVEVAATPRTPELLFNGAAPELVLNATPKLPFFNSAW